MTFSRFGRASFKDERKAQYQTTNNEDMNVKEHVKDDLNSCIFLQIQSIIMEENPGEQSSKEDPTV